MKIPMPLSVTEINYRTGHEKYGSQFSNAKMGHYKRGCRSMAHIIGILYRLDLSDRPLGKTPADKIKDLVQRMIPAVQIKEVNFYPLEGRLEIIQYETPGQE